MIAFVISSQNTPEIDRVSIRIINYYDDNFT